jgi:hypothetical protein
MEGLERFYVALIVAVLGSVAVFATAYVAKLGSSETIVLGAAAVIVAVVCGGFAWSGWDEHQQAAARGKIAMVITGAAEAEAGWYKSPGTSRTADLERYYVATGPGIGAIGQVVAHFRRERCRWGTGANEVINVQSVTTNGASATARTTEYYHQPRVCSGPPPPTPALGDENAKVTYELVRTPPGWRILSSSAIYIR